MAYKFIPPMGKIVLLSDSTENGLNIYLKMMSIISVCCTGTAWGQVAQPFIETEARIQKTADGVDLCFLPVETIVGAGAHIVIEVDPPRSDTSVFNGIKATTLTVSNTGAPIVLLLETGHSNGDLVWRFDIEAGAELVGVHLISDQLPIIVGLHANIPVTATYNSQGAEPRRNDCVYEDGTDSFLTTFGDENSWLSDRSFKNFDGIFDLAHWEKRLFEYAGIGVVSYQYSRGGWEDATVEVSEISVREFAETKARGQRLLDEAEPPELPFLDETTEPLRVPEGLGRDEIWPWIISMGYAMAAPAELFNYNCEIDRLFVMTLGLDARPAAYCRWRNPRGVQTWRDGIVLLGPLDMSDETCRASRTRGWVMSRPNVTVTIDGSDCSINPVDLARKTYSY